MPTFLIALASALVLAPLITEASQRFWPDNYFALWALAFVSLLINGLFNARLRQAEPAPAKAAPKADDKRPQGQRDKTRSPTPRRDKERNSRDDRAPREKKPQPKAKSERAPTHNAARGPLETGTVKWFNRSKGYGFIIRDNGDEVFVHQRSIVSEGDSRQRPVLRDGQKVSFVVAHLDKGAQAEQVTGLD